MKYATLATVSRCGMVWFSEDVLSTEMIFENYLSRLRHLPLEEGDDEASLGFAPMKLSLEGIKDETVSLSMQVNILGN